MSTVVALTAQEKRMIRDYLPALSDRPVGFDLAAKLTSLIASNNQRVAGQATIAIATDSITVALGADFANGIAVATMNAVDATATHIQYATVDSSGVLTVGAIASAAGNVVVNYIVIGV